MENALKRGLPLLLLLAATAAFASYQSPASPPSNHALQLPSFQSQAPEPQPEVLLIYDEQGTLDTLEIRPDGTPAVYTYEAFMCLGEPAISEGGWSQNSVTFPEGNKLQDGATTAFAGWVGIGFWGHNRYYDPELGRFTQPDPMGYADSMNLYQAFGQSPQNFGDPMGLLCDDLFSWGGLNRCGQEIGWITNDFVNEMSASVASAANAPLNLYEAAQKRYRKPHKQGTDKPISAHVSGLLNVGTLGWYTNTLETAEQGMPVGESTKVWAGGVSGIAQQGVGFEQIAAGNFAEGISNALSGTSQQLLLLASLGQGTKYIANKYYYARPAPGAISVEGAIDKSWKDLIEGRAHASNPHKIRTYREAINWAKSEQYEKIFINKPLTTVTGGQVQSGLRPDVSGILKGGQINVLEIPSPSQTTQQMLNKIQTMEDLLDALAGPGSGVAEIR